MGDTGIGNQCLEESVSVLWQSVSAINLAGSARLSAGRDAEGFEAQSLPKLFRGLESTLLDAAKALRKH